MDPKTAVLLVAYALINCIAFILMLVDKARSRKTGSERISEGLLFFMAIMFGSIGVFAGMYAFRHKTAKWYFRLGIPMTFVQNCASVYVLHLAIQ